MTELRNEVYEIKKESVKQFFIIVSGAFVGCVLAILLMGQLLKPKCTHCPSCHFVPPAYAHMMHHKPYGIKSFHKTKLDQHCERKAPSRIKPQPMNVDKNLNPPVKNTVAIPAKQVEKS